MTEAATTRDLWEQYQDAGEDVLFWHYRAQSSDGPAIRQLVFALFRQHMILSELLGIGAKTVVLCMLAFALSCQFCDAENLPDAPSATPAVRVETQQPAFWTHNELAGTVTHAALRAIDTATSCVDYSRGHGELDLPFKSCGGLAAWNAGVIGAQIGIDYLLHRYHHDKMRRFVPWVFAAVDAVAIGQTAHNWRK